MNYSKACIILSVEKGADESAIKKAYRKLAMVYHPDKNPDNSEKFLDVQKAYDYMKSNKCSGVYGLTHIDILDIKVVR